MAEYGVSLAKFLLNGDQDGAWEYIKELKDQGKDSLYLFEQVVTPAMRHIGLLWEKNQITVADEHLATSTCDYLLARYKMEAKRENQPAREKNAMFLCVESEQHYLGLKMASMLFEEAGWQTRFLGPNLPLDYVLKAAADWKPDAVCLSFSIIYHAEHLDPYIKSIEKLPSRPKVMIGGRLLGKYEFTRYGSKSTIFIKSLEQVKTWLDSQQPGVKSSVSY